MKPSDRFRVLGDDSSHGVVALNEALEQIQQRTPE
jgi:hypothetical protein